jgi:hypothetical protein
MLQTLAFAACLAVVPAPTTRDDAAADYVTFRASHRGLVTSIQCDYFGGFAFEGHAFSFQQHGRRLTIRGLNGQLECTAEDGTVIAVGKELRVKRTWLSLAHCFKDPTTGEIVIRVCGVNRDPKIVSLPSAASTPSAESK